MRKRVLVALGGNAILQKGQRGTAEEQLSNVRHTAVQVASMIEAGYDVVVTHGNGPQVGAIVIQNELGSSQVPAMPLDVCGAQSQGMIGYFLCQSLINSLTHAGLGDRLPVCVVTQVEVDPNDPAFLNPTKPIGPFYTEGEARRRMAESGEKWIEDSGRGWRRVVPSPDPVRIVESVAIRNLADAGFIVIASGGGGIPVVKLESGEYRGVEAVIDKDLAGEKLAQEVCAHILLILTDVPKVAINFRTPQEKWLGSVTVDELERYKIEGHFRAGSMGPKVEAALRFVKDGGERAIIASLDNALEALSGQAGTQVLP